MHGMRSCLSLKKLIKGAYDIKISAVDKGDKHMARLVTRLSLKGEALFCLI